MSWVGLSCWLVIGKKREREKRGETHSPGITSCRSFSIRCTAHAASCFVKNATLFLFFLILHHHLLLFFFFSFSPSSFPPPKAIFSGKSTNKNHATPAITHVVIPYKIKIHLQPAKPGPYVGEEDALASRGYFVCNLPHQEGPPPAMPRPSRCEIPKARIPENAAGMTPRMRRPAKRFWSS